jgi:hypothetical protein
MRDNTIYIYDSSQGLITLIDDYVSLVWNEKYSGYGEFELVLGYVPSGIDLMSKYINISSSTKFMIIEKQDFSQKSNGDVEFKLSGHSLESILGRRIIFKTADIKPVTIAGNLQNSIKSLLNTNIITSSDTRRRITNFVFNTSTDAKVTSKTIDMHMYTGDNLYDVITNLCDENGLGYRIGFVRNGDTYRYTFELYSGTDRSRDQSDTTLVEFSIFNDNIFNWSYSMEHTSYRNVAYVDGEGDAPYRKHAEISDEGSTSYTYSGLNLRELYVDARDLQKTDEMSDAQYRETLLGRGSEKLLEYRKIFEYDINADVLEGAMYEFGRDFFLGDIVNIIDVLGNSLKCRVSEITVTIDDTGTTIHPIFKEV